MTQTLCTLLSVVVLPWLAWPDQGIILYVSPSGSDLWSGTRAVPNADRTEGPFATLVRAQQAIRELRASSPTQPCTVFIRAGTYSLDAPLVLEPADSGSAEAPVTYAAYGDGTPIISGGRLITGWRLDGDGLWMVDLPEVQAGRWVFNQLFVNGQRRQRARHPNQGYLRTVGPLPTVENPDTSWDNPDARLGFSFRAGDLQAWEGLEDINVVLYHDWDTSLHWIANLDEQAGTVRFTNPSQWPICYWERDQRYHLENFRQALDAPGEWYLDRRTGRLTYWPLPGETPDQVRCIAPALHRLVEFRGEPEAGRFVEHVHFRGLSFQHADWSLPRDRCAQAQAAAFLSAAIYARGARNCSFDRCEIAHVGEYAVWLQDGCTDNRIFHCEMRDMGGGGVRIGPEGPPAQEALRTERNMVDNCFIHDGGHVFAPGVGIWIGQSGSNIITHNEMCDLRYSGISAGWTWGYGPSLCQHNVIEWNHIHHLGFGVLSELSAIYTLGISPGTRIRYNLLHDTYDYRYGSWGIGLDEGTSHVLVENNLIYNHGHGIGLHYGRDNEVRNNIIAFSRVEALGIGRIEEHVGLCFERNIFLSRNGILLSDGTGDRKIQADYNLYWDTGAGRETEIAGFALDEWQALGFDAHSLIADPRFVNAEAYDFRLQPDSPALALGFQPFDLSAAGLYGEPEWVQAPRRIQRPPVESLAVVQTRQDTVYDDFEDTPVGALPREAKVSGEDKGASIRVTDEAAAGGVHSLKLTDAPGLSAIWQPHMWYSPVIRRGVAILSFDVRLEAGARLVHQWRDWRTNPFKTGPTLIFEAGGDLRAGGRVVTRVPVGQWLRVVIRSPVGREAKTFALSVSTPGAEPIRVDDLPMSTEGFRQLNWVGFISEAEDRSVIYLDNVDLRREEP